MKFGSSQRVQQLALVLVQALHLDVEHRVRIQHKALMAVDPGGKALLVVALHRGELLHEGRVVRERQQLLQLHEVGAPALADGLVHELGEGRVGQHEPAPRRDAVGDGQELLRHDAVVVREGAALQDVAVQLGDAVDRVGIGDAHVGHVRLVVGQDGHVADLFPLAGEVVEQLLAEAAVHLLHDGVDARQRLPQHALRPLLQGFRHDGVVRVGDGGLRDALGLVPGQALLVHEDAHELRNHQRGMGVVDVEGDLLRQQRHVVADVALEDLHSVLQRGARQEVLLHEAQLLALGGVVLRVEHLGDPARDGVLVLMGGQAVHGRGFGVEVVGQHGAPGAQAVHDLAVVAHDGQVIGHGDDVLRVLEGDVVLPVHPLLHETAAEVDRHGVPLGRDLPGVAVGQPLVRHLHLLAVYDALAEEAVLVADGAADGGEVQGRHGVQEAGGQTAQAAVAQRGFRLLVEHLAQGEAQLLEGLLVLLGGA